MNADRQQVYIAGFVQPSLPEEGGGSALSAAGLRNVGIALLCAVPFG